MSAERSQVQLWPKSKQNEMKFKSPADFVESSLETVPSFMLNKLCSSSSELWLIKAPVDFNPECFNSQKVPLCGFQSLKSKKDGASRRYSIFSSSRDLDSSYLLVPSSEEGQLACGPAFSGYLNVCENFSGSTRKSPPKAISASPAPQIPEGLKQRFQPFGATPLYSGLQRKRQLKKSTKKRKIPIAEVITDKGMGRARQLESMKQEPVEGETWGNMAQACEVQSLSIDTTDAKKKKRRKREPHGAGDIVGSQELDEMRTGGTIEETKIPTEDKLEQHCKKKKRKRKPIEEGFVLVAEEENSGFQDKMEKVFLGEMSELIVNKADRKQKRKNKKSKRELSDRFASIAEEQSSDFCEKTKEHRRGNKKKKKQ
uniref:DNA-directed RNA polymerase I subunit RPA34 isoform X1 n=1 Tax=Geotrypetes seraphini TaxID=260995 RepID=A0A6P8S3D5_GEOSA|nr:DNA-directed RNA polymerase I subunit RPA34 isoform X1 [Geotrypetes seraphini]